jgi:hypothetical protein
MKRHTTNEGYEIFAGLNHAGWQLAGKRLPINETAVPTIIKNHCPGTVLVQDEREWDVQGRDFRDRDARFHVVSDLALHPEIFTLTILKDSHQRPEYHRESMARMGCHAVIHYYHPRMVKHFAPYVRERHLIRTWHSLDADLVPAWGSTQRRDACLLSGALSTVYPLRKRLVDSHRQLPGCIHLPHPGYHMRGTHTPAFLRLLPEFKVAICTTSTMGYALRKLIEATACGCAVITDLPVDEVLPEIDGNMIRVATDVTVNEVRDLIRALYAGWDEEKQRHFAERAKGFYDFREVGARLSADIEAMRSEYNSR